MDKRLDRTEDHLWVSPLDEHKYKWLELPNGLRALVISDKTAERAAASLAVGVGSFADPEDIPGLAHFCEHMLFLGTEKYPEEASYTQYLSLHGGSSNAYTASRSTNFYFDIDAPYLHGALDRFAQFFIAPLFTPEATLREMKAVDSEFTNGLQDDDWRSMQTIHSLANPDHPLHKFTCGNLQTLLEIPEKAGINVRERLLDFYHTYYSANTMTLAVHGRESLETLSSWVLELFQDVRTTEKLPPSMTPKDNALPFTREHHFGHVLEIASIKDLHSLSLVWMAPPFHRPNSPIPVDSWHTLQTAYVVGDIIGDESEGSLLSLLRQKQWANGLWAGTDDDHPDFTTFSIDVMLTEKGLEQRRDVIALIFQFLDLLRRNVPLDAWRFEEQQTIATTEFLYMERMQPVSLVQFVAANLQTSPSTDALLAQPLHYPYNPDSVGKLLQLLTPDRMMVQIASKNVETEAEEKYYGTKYRHYPVDANFIASLSSLPTSDSMRLPRPNDYICRNFSLIKPQQVGLHPSAQGVDSLKDPPKKLRDDDFCRLWYKPDVHFDRPRSYIHLSIYTRAADISPLTTALTNLFVNCLHEELAESTYKAMQAGVMYDVSSSSTAIHLDVSGYSGKVHKLLNHVVSRMLCFCQDITTETFGRVKRDMKRSYDNMRLDESCDQAMQACRYLLLENEWSVHDMRRAISRCRLPMVHNHARMLFRQCYLEAIVYGNLVQDDARSIVSDVLHKLVVDAGTTPVPFSQLFEWSARHVQLPIKTECIYPVANMNPNSTNSAVDVEFEIGRRTLWDRVCVAIVDQVIQDPFFNQLRTNEQLGYTVFCYPVRRAGIQRYRLVVQSSVAAPEYLDQRIDSFLLDMSNSLASMDTVQFQKYVKAVAQGYRERPKNQEEEMNVLTSEILSQQYSFGRFDMLAELAETVTLPDVLDFFDQHLSPDAPNRRKLSVRVYGKTTPLEQMACDDLNGALTLHAAGVSAATTFAPEISDERKGTKTMIIEDPIIFKQSMDMHPAVRPWQTSRIFVILSRNGLISLTGLPAKL